MAERVDVTAAMRSDDVAALSSVAERLSDIDAPCVTPTDGSKVSLLFAAALFDAAEIAQWLVQRGADPLLVQGGASPNAIAAGNMKLRALVGMVSAGYLPDQVAMLAFSRGALPSEIPLSPRQTFARQLLEQPQFKELTGDVGSTREEVARSASFRDAYGARPTFSGAAAKRRRRSPASAVFAPEVMSAFANVRATVDEALMHEATLIATMLEYGRPLIVVHADTVLQVVREEFYGQRNELKWIERATKRASLRLSEEFIAERLGILSDDGAALEVAGFALSLLPIRALVRGAGQSTRSARIDGRAFEGECATRLRDAGFLVSLTGGSGDQGADLIANREGRSFVIQCKDVEGPVGNAAVQEAAAGRLFYSTDYAVVCSKSGFTKAAQALASRAEVLLVRPDQLQNIDMLARVFD